MNLAENEIHIWSIKLNVTEDQIAHCEALLSPDELTRANRFHFPEHRRRFIIARGSLRQILSSYINTDSKKIFFSYNEHGKPILASPENNLHFNISHSEDLAVVAIAHQLVGIDIEKIQSTYSADLPARFFSPQECESLLAIPFEERTTAFYILWARKEAIVKADGNSLAISLANFSVTPADIQEKVLLNQNEWCLQPIETNKDFAGALASKYLPAECKYYNFN